MLHIMWLHAWHTHTHTHTHMITHMLWPTIHCTVQVVIWHAKNTGNRGFRSVMKVIRHAEVDKGWLVMSHLLTCLIVENNHPTSLEMCYFRVCWTLQNIHTYIQCIHDVHDINIMYVCWKALSHIQYAGIIHCVYGVSCAYTAQFGSAWFGQVYTTFCNRSWTDIRTKPGVCKRGIWCGMTSYFNINGAKCDSPLADTHTNGVSVC